MGAWETRCSRSSAAAAWSPAISRSRAREKQQSLSDALDQFKSKVYLSGKRGFWYNGIYPTGTCYLLSTESGSKSLHERRASWP